MQLSGQSAMQICESCPQPDELEQFLLGDLPDDRSTVISKHVSQCPRCEQAARENPAVRRARLPANAFLEPLTREPECQRLIAAVSSREFAAQTASDDRGSPPIASPPAAPDKSTANPHDITDDGAESLSVTRTYAASMPETIGRYQVVSLLGEGSFGTVYLARDPELNRNVAIKVPRFAETLTARRVEAFLQEARTAARLRHPAIVTIHDVGCDAGGTVFLAMEFVEGQTLRKMIADRRLSPDEASKIVEEVARAVHYAHKQGLVHRDLKPANILVDAENHAKITDFGLALLADQQQAREGEFAGTLVYMAPEQARREAHRLDGRADVWSLGIILYELLAGRRPFTGTREQILDELLHREPRPLRQIDDTIPPRLEQICVKCLRKDVAGRYSTARDLADDLRLFRQPQSSFRARLRRHRVAIALAGLVALTAAAFSIPSIGRQKTTDTPQVAAEIDLDQLPRLRSHWLLDRHPKNLFPGDADPNENWQYDTDRREFRIDTRTPVLFSIGRTRATSYRFEIDLTRNVTHGSAGIFLGFEPAEPENGRTAWTCQAILSTHEPNDKLSIERQVLRLVDLGNGVFNLNVKRLARVEVKNHLPQDTLLEVQVSGGRLTGVFWKGLPLDDLCDRGRGNKEVIPGTTGKLGVINCRGTVMFTNARFKAPTGGS